MTATSEHLARAAAQLDALLRTGQRDLASPDEARIAAHARDQVAVSLSHTLTVALAQLGRHHDRRTFDLVSSLAGGLRTRAEGLDAPSVLQLVDQPPATDSARRWVRAAVELEQTAVQASRPRPLPGAEAWALTADLAGLSSALAFADVDLARALLWTGEPALGQVSEALLDVRAVWLRRDALTAVTRAQEQSQVPSQDQVRHYDLAAPPPQPPVTVLRHAGDLPAVLRHVEDQVLDQPLTHDQHRIVAHALAAIVNRMRQDVLRDPALHDADAAITTATAADQLVRAQIALATTWAATSYLRYADTGGLGAWQAALQLRTVAAQLAPEHRERLGRLEPEQQRETLSLTARLARAVNGNFADSLARRRWHLADHGPDGTLTWDTVVPADPDDLRVLRTGRFDVGDGQLAYLAGRASLGRVLAAQELTQRAAQDLRAVTGPAEHLTLATPVTGPTARDVLHTTPAPLFPRGRASSPATPSSGTPSSAITVTPEQLATMSDLVRAALPNHVADAVLADPQWPAAAARLHQTTRLVPDGTLDTALRTAAPNIDPAGQHPARSMLQAVHATTADSPGIRLTAQTRTVPGTTRATRTGRTDAGPRAPDRTVRDNGTARE